MLKYLKCENRDMAEITVRNAKLSDMVPIYELHEAKFPKPARARYYEELRQNKSAPFFVAIDEHEDLVGYLATRVVEYKDGVRDLTIAVFASEKDDEEEIKRMLLERVVEFYNMGGFDAITAQVRESAFGSRKALTEVGFKFQKAGKYKDGETKYLFTYENLDAFDDDDVKIIKMKAKHIYPIMRMHNKNLKSQKKYRYFNNLLNNKGGVALVAVNKRGTVVGYLLARKQRNDLDDEKSPRKTLSFVSLAVDEKGRGKGLGTRLLQTAIQKAKEGDTEIIRGHVRESNKKAIEVYRRLGFRLIPEGKYKDTEEIKYRLHMRLKYPPIWPIIKPYAEKLALVGVGVIIGRTMA